MGEIGFEGLNDDKEGFSIVGGSGTLAGEFDKFIPSNYLGGDVPDYVDGLDAPVSGDVNKLVNRINGTTRNLFLNGENLGEVDLEAYNSASYLSIRPDFSNKVVEKFKTLKDQEFENEALGNFQDVFRALDVRKISFKPVQDNVPDNFEGSLPGPDKVKEKTSNMSLGLILPVVAVLGLIYLVVFR